MPVQLIERYGGYRKMYSFGWTCLIYHATTLFCSRNFNYKNDALGKTAGQMIGAARSARQNIVEGSSRAGTSKETELRLYDVAKGSLEELSGDYETFLIDLNKAPWSTSDSRYQAVWALELSSFDAEDDVVHRYGEYTLEMRARCRPWLENEDPTIAANAILITIRRAVSLLVGQIRRTAQDFVEAGGFTERMSAARLEVRDAKFVEEGAPSCPICGKAMRKRVARKGRNAGNAFWSCTGYPTCHGTRAVEG